MMDLVGEIVKVTDQTQLHHNTVSESGSNVRNTNVSFQTCFTSILELLHVKLSELIKRIKKYKIDLNSKNNKEVQVGEKYEDFKKITQESAKLKIQIGQYERQNKKLKNTVEGMSERLEKNIHELEKVRLAFRESEEQNSKTMILLSEEKITHKQTSKKY